MGLWDIGGEIARSLYVAPKATQPKVKEAHGLDYMTR